MNLPSSQRPDKSLAVVYLARGADTEPLQRFRRFVASYQAHAAGIEHDLFIVFKGFATTSDRSEAEQIFAPLDYTRLETDDENFDLGAYHAAARVIQHDRICFLNTNSEIAAQHWLAKLAVNLERAGIGIAGATGSYESLSVVDSRFPLFPNVHLRSNAFILSRPLALDILPPRIADKNEAYLAESGPNGVTHGLFARGLSIVVVGRDGRGYPPQWWPMSETFRLAKQANLLVHDNSTRHFESLSWPEKRSFSENTWGRFLDEEALLVRS